MTATDKRPFISESVTVTQIDIHPAGEEHDRHIIHVAPRVSRTTTIHEVPTKSKLGLCSRYKVLSPSDARLGRHPELPHYLSNKQPQSSEGRFNKVITGLLGLPGPIKSYKWSVQIKVCYQGQNGVILNWHRRRLPPWNLIIANALSPPFPSKWSTFP
jgi:hypothetical protein